MTRPHGFLDSDRARYVDPSSEGLACTGSKSACRFLIDEGAAHAPWGEPPDALAELRVLHLLPPARTLKKPALPDYLPQATALRRLAMPAPLVAALDDPARLPPSLSTLQLDFDPALLERGPKPLRWPQASLPDLRGLYFVGPSQSTTRWIDLGLQPAQVPGLEFLSCELDPAGQVRSAVAEFASLRHVELADIANHSDIFDDLPKHIEALSLRTSKLKFSLAGLVRLTRIRGLRLNAIRTEIDCGMLASLPALEQLVVLNSKKLTKLDALLEAPELTHLSVLHCGRPFKKELEARFEAKGFEVLDIAFS
ncbi:hypothetical protein G6O69_04175 [Pseudenhygromyxa sp. WMMC2535]|uniref:hypothetical protein n=1 Tax=Pseudenhygromyxa sp. WMMC2535 TaxID=2712867 RepID=UPI0015549077|nr:hypothetical protein [Pseudenhygromyxa sp. WMMC2535]NVB37014.1 hypothetical protein [Pseudenhygromyxa sp. WMMC2535]